MQLHIIHGSPNGHKVLATASHLAIELDVQKQSLMGPELKSEKFLALNPNGKTPVLADGELSLWESNAICAYLAANKAPGNDLFSGTDRPLILQWMFWETNHYNRAFGSLAWETVIKPGLLQQQPDEALVKNATEDFHYYAAVLDKHLAGTGYMVGSNWTIADYTVGCLEKFMDATVIDFGQYPNVESFYRKLRDNQHWAETRVSLEQMAGD